MSSGVFLGPRRSAALKFLKGGKPQAEANWQATYLRKTGNQILQDRGINGWLYGRGITHLYLGPIEFDRRTKHCLPPMISTRPCPRWRMLSTPR